MTRALGEIERVDLEFNEKHPRGERGTRKGGQFVRKGDEDGTKTEDPPKPPPRKPPPRKPPPRKPTKPPPRKDTETVGDRGTETAGDAPKTPPPMSVGAKNDPTRVRRLQRLLSTLGLGKLAADGIFGPKTEAAVKAVQRKLGMRESGRVSNTMLNKLDMVSKLSPCVSRSVIFDRLRVAFADEVTEITSVSRAYTTPRGGGDMDNKPYGDVDYADPGYQEDGKARYRVDSEKTCRAAWSYINQSDNAAKYSPDELSKIKGRIKAAGERYGIEFAEDASRSEEVAPVAEILRYERLWPLDDIVIRSGGDGRTVEAYAAVFDTPSEITDQHGHYMEVIDRKAFNRAISHGIERVGVFYHHGMTLHGTPSDLGSVPIGSPLDIRPDGKGLRTVTRYNKSALADSVLEAIKNNDIRGYSFRGRVFQSTPQRVPRGRNSSLPTVTRTELGLTEYGPTPTPAYSDAGILAVRSVAALATQLTTLDPQGRAELVRILNTVSTSPDPEPSTPVDPQTDTATPDVGPGTEDSPDIGRSGRKEKLAAIMARLHEKGIM